MNNSGKIPQSSLLVIPVLLAVGILLMFFVGKTGQPSKDILYEDLESRIKNLEQRLARLERNEEKAYPTDARVKEPGSRPGEKADKTVERPEAAAVTTPPWQALPEKPFPPEPQPAPESMEKAAREGFHQVMEGETLFRISRIYGVSVDDLRRWNNLSPGEGIRTGQKLRIEK